MALTQEKKQETIQKFQKSSQDTGSSEVQVALLTQEINDLTGHLKLHPKDFASLRGLYQKVGRRRRLLNYLKKSLDPTRYAGLLSELNLRK